MRNLVLTLTIAIISVNCSAQINPGERDNLISIGHLDTLHSEILDEPRELWIHIPSSGQDSVPCIICCDGSPQFYDVEGRWERYSIAHIRSVQIGVWNYYHSNGKLKMTGSYSGKVHSYTGSVAPYEWEQNGVPISKPIPRYIRYDPLKTGQWQYYDSLGNNYLTEDYVDGALVPKVERKR